MAFMQVQFFSETLHMAAAADVIIPQAVTHEIGMSSRETADGKHPVLWLLHGATDDHTTWQRRTSIERYAASRGLAIWPMAALFTIISQRSFRKSCGISFHCQIRGNIILSQAIPWAATAP